MQEIEDTFWVHDEASDAWVARHFKGGRRLVKCSRQGKRKGPGVEMEKVCVPTLKFSRKDKEQLKARPKDQKGRQNNPSLGTGQKEKVNLRPSARPTKE